MTVIGVGSALFIYKSLIGMLPASEMIDNNLHLLMYITLLVSTILIFFFKPAQGYTEMQETALDIAQNEIVILSTKKEQAKCITTTFQDDIKFLNNKIDFYNGFVTDQAQEIEKVRAISHKILNGITQELRRPICEVINFVEMLSDSLDQMDKKLIKELADEVAHNPTRLSTLILNMLDLATLNITKIKLTKKTMNLGELVKAKAKKCHELYLDHKPIDLKLTLQPEVLVSIDPNYMRQVVEHLVINAIKFSDKGLIEIRVTRNIDSAILIVKDEGRSIPPDELYNLFTLSQTSSISPSKGRKIGLGLCCAAVRAHGGRIDADSSDVGAIFTVVLPLKVLN